MSKLQLEIASKYLGEGFLDSKGTVCFFRQVRGIRNFQFTVITFLYLLLCYPTAIPTKTYYRF